MLDAALTLDPITQWAVDLTHLLPNARTYPVALVADFKERASSAEKAALRDKTFQLKSFGADCRVNVMDMVVATLNTVTDAVARSNACQILHLLIDMGFDPNRYNGAATPVGYAGYTYQVDVLRLFADHGADLRLEISREHAGSSGLGLTTLLHRMGMRAPILGPTLPTMVETIVFLTREAPSVQTDESGFSVVNDPYVPNWFKELVQKTLDNAVAA